MANLAKQIENECMKAHNKLRGKRRYRRLHKSEHRAAMKLREEANDASCIANYIQEGKYA